ncbi:hypothetical protein GH714_016921 [Hevea brasiliensis]|uniref:Uncharacterized protein n=1 Tax=Hevea brasiliensis TaxID=3981 RepID=A0A6A6N2B9_HEVBR|nr:hypothetical protein GH714_016921 [Hevea brasiliensis]
MEALDTTATNYDASWSSATNWIVAGGCLDNSVTFESSLSLVDDDKDDNHDQSSTMSSAAKSPLILYPPSPDSTSCEITITFAQKHEVRQVYVRSTSRVYEIYYASELQCSSEYLCTVRCGIAVRDEDVLHATGIEEAVLAHQKRSTKELAEERIRNGSGVTTNEDDWVEVKVPDPQLANMNSSLSSHSDTSQGRGSKPQDLYEATADITDANPCASITLRLLSLQNKSCVCIDEVYMFADPVDGADLDNKVGPVENSAGSSLMAVLMPTFLQLSKTKGVGLAQDKYDSDRMNRWKSDKLEGKPTDPIDAGNEIQKEGKSDSIYQQGVQVQEAVMPGAKLEIPPQVSDTESKPELSHNQIESVLNQLVSRVTRIEDLFLQFEDCMLKPLRSIDERLQRVEQQLEVLTKKPQNSGLLSCTRISAPEFSCSESETNSLYNSGYVDINYAACDASKKDSLPAVSSILSDATPVSVNTSKSHPSLVVTAPEFSNFDDEEEDDAVEPVMESPKEKQRHVMSIDDALASALAGFVSSTSIQSPRYSKTLAFKAPEFPNGEGNNDDNTVSPKCHCEISTEHPTGFSETEGTELPKRLSFSSVSNISSLESEENAMKYPNDNYCLKTDIGVGEQLQDSEGDEGDTQGTCFDHTVPAANDIARTGSYQITDDIQNGEVGNGTSNIWTLGKTDSLEQFSGNQTDSSSDTLKEVAVSNEIITCIEVTDEGPNLDILQDVVELSRAATKVDFEAPILEVKFTSQENLNIKSPIEALLAGTPDVNIEAHSAKKIDENDSQIGDQYNLIPVDDWGVMGSVTDIHLPRDTDYYNLTLLPLNAEDASHFI